MRILIISQVFAPEMGALANRMTPIVRQLTASGHEVFVATGMPNYPDGIVFPQYQGKRFMREEIDGATVLRTAYYTTPRNRSKWGQLASYASFIPAAYHSGLRAGKVDLVFATSPPIFPVAAAIPLARRSRARLVFDVRDLWPDEIIACGAAREGSRPVRAIRALERWAYRTADLVTCTTPAFMETVVSRGVPRERAMLVPNGADLEVFRPVPPQPSGGPNDPPEGKFVVMYSGLLGIKHGLEVILEAARLLREQRDIVFYLVGKGARAEALQARTAELGLDNVVFGGERRVQDLPALLSRADVCVSALLPEPYLEKIISVKIFEYLACERPVVAAQAGESARVLAESGGGLVTPPGDPRAMADAILSLYRDPERRRRMGQEGRAYVEEHYSRTQWAARLEERFRAICQPGAAEATQPVRDPVRVRS